MRKKNRLDTLLPSIGTAKEEAYEDGYKAGYEQGYYDAIEFINNVSLEEDDEAEENTFRKTKCGFTSEYGGK